MPRIILASQSPRRRQLLGQLGLEDFTILVPDVDESYDPALSPEEIVSSICRRKARAARDMADDGEAIIIAADTMSRAARAFRRQMEETISSGDRAGS